MIYETGDDFRRRIVARRTPPQLAVPDSAVCCNCGHPLSQGRHWIKRAADDWVCEQDGDYDANDDVE